MASPAIVSRGARPVRRSTSPAASRLRRAARTDAFASDAHRERLLVGLLASPRHAQHRPENCRFDAHEGTLAQH